MSDEENEMNVDHRTSLERVIFTTINDGNIEELKACFDKEDEIEILQLLLTAAYPNDDGFYGHDPDVLADATELLGPSCSGLNAIHISSMLGEQEVSQLILSFVARVTDEIHARKILYEFMGRVWGNGNTVLHLAAFMGMSDLVKELLELGAAANKLNDNKYRPVDCADDAKTREMFTTITEVLRSNTPDPNHILQTNKSVESVDDFLTAPPRQFRSFGQLKPKKLIKGNTAISLDQLNLKCDETFKRLSYEEIDLKVKSTEDISAPTAGLKRSVSLAVRKRPNVNISTPTLSGFPQGASEDVDYRHTLTSISAKKKRLPKFMKSLTFDPVVQVLDICHYGDPKDNVTLPDLRKCINLSAAGPAVNVNEIYTPHQWLSPIHLASSHGHVHIVKFLLAEAQTAVNLQDREGWTPLHCACAEGHIEVIKLLGKCQGDYFDDLNGEERNPDWFYPADGPINLIAKNKDGETPKDILLEGKRGEIEALIDDLLQLYPPQPQEEEIVTMDESDEEEPIENIEVDGSLNETCSHDLEIVDDNEAVSDIVPNPKIIPLKKKPAHDIVQNSSVLNKNIVLLDDEALIDELKIEAPNIVAAASTASDPAVRESIGPTVVIDSHTVSSPPTAFILPDAPKDEISIVERDDVTLSTQNIQMDTVESSKLINQALPKETISAKIENDAEEIQTEKVAVSGKEKAGVLATNFSEEKKLKKSVSSKDSRSWGKKAGTAEGLSTAERQSGTTSPKFMEKLNFFSAIASSSLKFGNLARNNAALENPSSENVHAALIRSNNGSKETLNPSSPIKKDTNLLLTRENVFKKALLQKSMSNTEERFQTLGMDSKISASQSLPDVTSIQVLSGSIDTAKPESVVIQEIKSPRSSRIPISKRSNEDLDSKEAESQFISNLDMTKSVMAKKKMFEQQALSQNISFNSPKRSSERLVKPSKAVDKGIKGPIEKSSSSSNLKMSGSDYQISARLNALAEPKKRFVTEQARPVVVDPSPKPSPRPIRTSVTSTRKSAENNAQTTNTDVLIRKNDISRENSSVVDPNGQECASTSTSHHSSRRSSFQRQLSTLSPIEQVSTSRRPSLLGMEDAPHEGVVRRRSSVSVVKTGFPSPVLARKQGSPAAIRKMEEDSTSKGKRRFSLSKVSTSTSTIIDTPTAIKVTVPTTEESPRFKKAPFLSGEEKEEKTSPVNRASRARFLRDKADSPDSAEKAFPSGGLMIRSGTMRKKKIPPPALPH